MTVPAMWVMLGVLAILAVAYRYYSAFLAARVACLDASRTTPAHLYADGQNFHPTNRWVLFGHHFAAISGAGPLIGPVLAIQFGYLPGLIWLVIGVCLAGAVQDMLVLWASTRRGGMSLAGIARMELGRTAGLAAALAILYVVVVALAGLGIVVVKALGGEEVPMKAGTQLVYPTGAAVTKTGTPNGPTVYTVPSGSTYIFGEGADGRMIFRESFDLAVPRENGLKQAESGTGFTLPNGAQRVVPGSSWGTFTIATTIPIALFVGWYMSKLRPGRVMEASLIGATAVIATTYFGSLIPGSPLEPIFSLTREGTIYAIAIYGFIAAVLPVWLLLTPRDYLSSFLKIGTIGLLVAGVIAANPTLEAPAINPIFKDGGGPYFNGPIFPYVFICVMCGAISGFHALVSSGTTPKMVNRETDIRMIGYGAMLMEGLVGIVALIAAASLPSGMYYDINIDLAKRPHFTQQLRLLGVCMGQDCGPEALELADMEQKVGESLHGRTGGAVTLAVGMARIFTQAMPRLDHLIGFWYHFAIMFEALFILTTIDAGTRIARFLLQEFLGRIYKPLGDLDWLPASFLATGLVVFAWAYLIASNSVDTIWPMFGLANQLLALIALVVVTSILFNSGKGRYTPLTLLPALFVASTTLTTAVLEIKNKYLVWIRSGTPSEMWKGYLNTGLTVFVVACVAVITVAAVIRWFSPRPSEADLS